MTTIKPWLAGPHPGTMTVPALPSLSSRLMIRRFAFAFLPFAALVIAIASVGLRAPFAQSADHPIPEPFKKPPPSAFECRWTDTPITLDGVADEAAWKNAEPINAFHLAWLGEKA